MNRILLSLLLLSVSFKGFGFGHWSQSVDCYEKAKRILGDDERFVPEYKDGGAIDSSMHHILPVSGKKNELHVVSRHMVYKCILPRPSAIAYGLGRSYLKRGSDGSESYALNLRISKKAYPTMFILKRTPEGEIVEKPSQQSGYFPTDVLCSEHMRAPSKENFYAEAKKKLNRIKEKLSPENIRKLRKSHQLTGFVQDIETTMEVCKKEEQLNSDAVAILKRLEEEGISSEGGSEGVKARE